MFEDLIGLAFQVRIGCVSAEVALLMDQFLELGQRMSVSNLVSSGECGILPQPVLFEATDILNGEGEYLTIGGVVIDGEDRIPFFTHMGPGVAESIIERNNL